MSNHDIEAVRNGEVKQLRDADLRYANLRGADLRDATLRDATLRYADLRDATLRDANLSDTNLRGADLRGATLRDATLRYATLRGANLRYANLRGANLRDADLTAKQTQRRQSIPLDGAFTAYKAAQNHIVRLTIPANAARLQAIKSHKCRAEYVDVDEVLDRDGTPCDETRAVGDRDSDTEYVEGERTYPDKYNEDPRVECSHGIHFFMNKQQAIDWL